MKTNIKATYKYGISTLLKPTIVYYSIVIISTIFLVILNSVENIFISVNGFEVSSFIFLFVLALADFKENFNMLTQNNISRKNIFTGKVMTLTTLALLLSLMDRLIMSIMGLITKSNLVFSSLIEEIFNLNNMNMFLKQTSMFLVTFSIYLIAVSLGTFITIVFYRATKLGRVMIAAGIPIFTFIALPIIASFLVDTKIFETMGKLVVFITKTPLNTTLTGFAITLIFGSISWFLMRKVTANSK